MTDDASLGWEAIADRFATTRRDIGRDVVRRWAATLTPGATVVDIGCGTGWPVTATLADASLAVSGIDPSPTMLAAFRRALPDAPAACETVQQTRFFHQQFDGAVAIGLLFLLSEPDQVAAVARIADALRPGGRLLFSAPRAAAHWRDAQTGRQSRSLGEAGYRAALNWAGLTLLGHDRDIGGNDYHAAIKG